MTLSTPQERPSLDRSWTASTLAGINGVAQPTLGTWRDRYGLQLVGHADTGWSRFGLSDFVRVWLVRQIIDLEISARQGCETVNAVSDEIEEFGRMYLEDEYRHDESGAPFLVVRRRFLKNSNERHIVPTLGKLIDILSEEPARPALIIGLGAAVRRMAALLRAHTRPIEEGLDQNLSIEERAEIAWRDPEIQSEFGGTFDRYLAYRKAFEAGRVRHD